ncbi:flagellar motor switch protein FliG [Pontibaca sp. S1109L]|uniref:Flagellar motor switch protein FliG n=2 Tax=Pontibaca salina TaxID=2795731 RepID=A0A934LZY3_9RHOB|nr:FliG C-terminal domain-containing protein [Pontibaca salina]MBI6629173.1 flagellar motor switch protein FliG [Pontibaca salina]
MRPESTPERQVPRALDATEKAAIVVRLLLNEGADLPLEELPEDLQMRLTQQMGQMGLVDRVTLASVILEFADALDSVGLAFPHGLAEALTALDGQISAQTADRLRREAGVRQAGDPWTRLRTRPVKDLKAMAESESIEVAAVLLSKLETGKAAELLGTLPGPLARRITYAISQTGAVTPAAVDRIGLSLASQLDLKPPLAFEHDAGERVGEILNQSPAATRDDMLIGLDETDADFAQVVRRAIFTFVHIPSRIPARDVPKVVRAVEQAQLVTALAGAAQDHQTEAAATYLLDNMPNRLANSLRDEIRDKGRIDPRDAEIAMTAVTATIRQLQKVGEIELSVSEDEGLTPE